MSGLTLKEDKREMVVIRNKVLVTFETSFDIHPPLLSLASLFLSSHRLAVRLYTSLPCSLFSCLILPSSPSQ